MKLENHYRRQKQAFLLSGWLVLMLFIFSSCVGESNCRNTGEDDADALTYLELNLSPGESWNLFRASPPHPSTPNHHEPGTFDGVEELFITDILYFVYELDWEKIDPNSPASTPYTPGFESDPNIRFFAKEGGAIQGFHLTYNDVVKEFSSSDQFIYKMGNPQKITNPDLIDKYVGVMAVVNPEPQMLDIGSGLISQSRQINDGAAFLRLFSRDAVIAKNSSDTDPLYMRTNTFHVKPQYFDYASYFEGKHGITGKPNSKHTVRNRIPMTGYTPCHTQKNVLFLKSKISSSQVRNDGENTISLSVVPVPSRLVVSMNEAKNKGRNVLVKFNMGNFSNMLNLYIEDIYAEVVNGERESLFFPEDTDNPKYGERFFSPKTRYSDVVDNSGEMSFSVNGITSREQAENYMLYFDRRYTQANQVFPDYRESHLSSYAFNKGESQEYAAVRLSGSKLGIVAGSSIDPNGQSVGSPGFCLDDMGIPRVCGYELMDAWHIKNLSKYSLDVQNYYAKYAANNPRNRVPMIDDNPMAVFPTYNNGKLSIPYAVPNLYSQTGFANNEKLYASIQTTGMYPLKTTLPNYAVSPFDNPSKTFDQFLKNDITIDERTPNIISVFFGENSHVGGAGSYKMRNTPMVLFTVIARITEFESKIKKRSDYTIAQLEKYLGTTEFERMDNAHRLMIGAPLANELKMGQLPPGMKTATELNQSAHAGGFYNNYLVLGEDGFFYHSIFDATHDSDGKSKPQKFVIYRLVYRTIGGNSVPHPYNQISNIDGYTSYDDLVSYPQNLDHLRLTEWGTTTKDKYNTLPPPFNIGKTPFAVDEFSNIMSVEDLSIYKYDAKSYAPCIVMYYTAYLNPNNLKMPTESPTARNKIYHIHIHSFSNIGMNYNPLSLYGRYNTTKPYEEGKWKNPYGDVQPFGQYFRDYDPMIDVRYFENNFGGIKDGPGTPYDPSYCPPVELDPDVAFAPEDPLSNLGHLDIDISVAPWIVNQNVENWAVPYVKKQKSVFTTTLEKPESNNDLSKWLGRTLEK